MSQQQPAMLVGLEPFASVELVEQHARLRIEPDVPAPARIVDGRHARHAHVDAEQMPDPAADQLAQPLRTKHEDSPSRM